MEKWKEVLGGIAPVLAGALGGPFAAAAAKVIADKVLGNPDATEAEVEQAILSGSLTGPQILELKAADREFQLELQRISADTEKAYLLDVQDARARQVETKDTMPQQIFYIVFSAYVMQYLLFYFGPTINDQFIQTLIIKAFGITEGALIGAIAYFIGSSRGSKASGDAVRKIAENANK